MRFDDFSSRQGKIVDYASEFSVPIVADEEFFPIVGWLIPWSGILDNPNCGPDVDGVVKGNTVHLQVSEDHLLAEYALCNFNLGRTAKFGTRCNVGVPMDDSRLTESGEDPLCWGFHGPDKPGEERFPELGRASERVKRFAPSKRYWVNLRPTYGFASLAEYDHHVKTFLDVVSPKFFTYDHYCMVGSDQASRNN